MDEEYRQPPIHSAAGQALQFPSQETVGGEALVGLSSQSISNAAKRVDSEAQGPNIEDAAEESV